MKCASRSTCLAGMRTLHGLGQSPGHMPGGVIRGLYRLQYRGYIGVL